MSKNFLKDMDMVKVKHQGRKEPERQLEVKNKDAKRPRYSLWLVAGISLLFFLFALSNLFGRATVTLNPKMQDISLNEDLSASKGGEGDTLPFDLIVISGEENKTVQTTGVKDVTERSEGVVLIYNAFSSATQRLSIDTRLEGSNGKIYKTKTQIVVPGMKGSTPGSIEVGIYGAEAGEEYNSGPLDFTIFGFKGTPKYSKFYARSKGPIAGGFEGKASIISDADRSSTVTDLKTALEAKLFEKATDQIPSGFILFKDAVFLNIDDSNIDSASLVSSDNVLPVAMTGTLYGILFDEEKLTKKIAEKNIDGYDGSALYMLNIRDLIFSLPAQAGLSNKDSISFADLKNINFNLSGATKIVWKVDESKLLADLLGKSKKDFNQILLQYPNIDSATLSISPFWRRSLPDKTKDIKVIVNYPE